MPKIAGSLNVLAAVPLTSCGRTDQQFFFSTPINFWTKKGRLLPALGLGQSRRRTVPREEHLLTGTIDSAPNRTALSFLRFTLVPLITALIVTGVENPDCRTCTSHSVFNSHQLEVISFDCTERTKCHACNFGPMYLIIRPKRKEDTTTTIAQR